MATDIQVVAITTTAPLGVLVPADELPVPPGSAAWGAITGTLASQTDLGTALSGKAASTHAHAAADVTGTAVVTDDARLSDARTPVTHAHAANDVTGTAVVTNDARLSDARTPTTHSHATSDVTGTAVVTNDARLSDARTPLTHAHDYEPANANIQTHVTSSHAPANAQANADITKAEIEAKLTGELSSHSHAGGSGQPLGMTTLANDTLAQALATNINTKLTVTAARTLTTTVPVAGTRCSVLVLTAGTTSYVITFGTGFKPVGTLATGTTAARIFVVNFISNGTVLYEAGRTAAMVA